MKQFVCPGCNGMFQVADEHVGKIVRCPTCREPLDTSLGADRQVSQPQSAGLGPQPTSEPPGHSQPVPPGDAGGLPPQAPPGTGYPPPGWPAGFAQPPRPPPNPHGIFSFILGLAGWLGMCLAGLALARHIPRLESGGFDLTKLAEQQKQIIANLPGWYTPIVLLLAGLSIIGLILGIYALTRPGRRKGFAIAGVIICGLNACCFAGDAISALLRLGNG